MGDRRMTGNNAYGIHGRDRYLRREEQNTLQILTHLCIHLEKIEEVSVLRPRDRLISLATGENNVDVAVANQANHG
jgi:hypothetical protein